MKVILVKDVDKLGKCGSIVDVKHGYARNYLIPHGLALKYNESNLKKFNYMKKLNAIREEKLHRKLLNLKERLESISLTLPVITGSDGKLFGTITSGDIEELLKKEGIDIDKKNIIIPNSIKETGVYQMDIVLSSDIKAKVRVWVVSKE